MNKIILSVFCLIFFLNCLSFPQERKITEPIILNGDRVEYFPDKNVMVGEGNVEVIYKGMFLYADKITVWIETEEALAEGNVKLLREGATFYGDKISYNLKENKGKVIAPSFQEYGPWYGKGLEAEEYEKAKYLITDAYVTTCELIKPHYRFQAKTVKVYLNDRIVARNVVFYIKDTPVFYLPYFSRSLKDKKSPWVIIPGRNDEWSWYLLSAYRYYLNEEQSGRVKLDYREKKGFAHGIDHNYKFNFGEGLFKCYYMNEKDSVLANNDRYRFSLRHRWQPDEYTSVFAEYNKMSDINFIKDYFYEQEYEKDPQPDTYFYVMRGFPYLSMNLNLRKRANHFFTEVERLPEIGLDVNDLKIKNSNFYYSSRFYFSNLTKKLANSDQDDDVLRFDTYNEISYAKNYFGFLNLTSYIGLRETFYSKDIDGEEHKVRTAFYTGFDASTKFYKIIQPESGRFLLSKAESVRHVVMPILRYAYITEPTIVPSRLMQFDDIDAIERKSRLTFALENLWQIKYELGEEIKKRDLMRLNVSCDYDFRIEGGSRWQRAEILAEYLPYDWLRFESEASYDLKPGHFNTFSFDGIVNRERWQLGLGQRYEKDISSQLTTEFKYKINDKWSFRTYQRYEFETQAPERQEFSLYRDLHCWLAEFSFVNNRLDGNKTFFIIFTLKAFPEYPFRFSQSYHPPGS